MASEYSHRDTNSLFEMYHSAESGKALCIHEYRKRLQDVPLDIAEEGPS